MAVSRPRLQQASALLEQGEPIELLPPEVNLQRLLAKFIRIPALLARTSTLCIAAAIDDDTDVISDFKVESSLNGEHWATLSGIAEEYKIAENVHIAFDPFPGLYVRVSGTNLAAIVFVLL